MTLDVSKVTFDEKGLVPVIAQDAHTGDVLMMAWADQAALEKTQATGLMHYHSRKRGPWMKGETSGNKQRVLALEGDCDGDTILALVEPEGPACHDGSLTCFGRPEPLAPALARLAHTIDARAKDAPPGSYTRKLLDNAGLASKKIGEESAELVHALAAESEARVAEEAADVLYHVLVACRRRGVGIKDVAKVLEARAAAEKRRT